MKSLMKQMIAIVLAVAACAACSMKNDDAAAVNDTMAPYINMRQYEFYTEVNKPLYFSNIGGYDDIDGMLPTRLRGYVDYSRPGEYYPSIVCTDLSGNESEQVITIHVVESGQLPVAEETETPEPTPSTCEKGSDPEQPCSVVLAEELAPYNKLYPGDEGKAQCEDANGEDACEVIHRNDGSFWGYGAK